MELFNDSHFSTHQVRGDALFHPFPRLPLELRLCIWGHYLRRPRFIPVRIHQGRNLSGQPDYSLKNGLGKNISGRCSCYVSYYGSSLSPLLRVNSEARKAALDFYRVHLPLAYSARPGREDEPPPCLYVNPEHDVLAPVEFPDDRVRHWRPWNLANFLHDIKAYDPRDVGVVHLALRPNSSFLHRPEDHRFPSGGLLFKDEFREKLLRAIDPQAAAALHDMLQNRLSSVFFLNYLPLEHYSTRVVNPSDTSRPFAAQLLRGFPLRRHLEAVTDFDWLEADPRPVETDLKGLALHDGDPDDFHVGWLHVEEALGVRRQRPVDFLICPAVNWRLTTLEHPLEPSEQDADKQLWRPSQPHTRDGLARFLAKEQEDWAGAHNRVGKERLRLQRLGRLPGDLPQQETQEGLESEAQSVVGAWVLPRSAFGSTSADSGGLTKYDPSVGRPGLIVFKYAVA